LVLRVQGIRDPPAPLEHKVRPVLKALQDHRARPASTVLLERPAPLVRREKLVLPARLDPKDRRESLALRVRLALLDHRDLRE
jgi:hypothetical protein